MAVPLFDRVFQTSVTTGTGTLTLSVTIPTGYRSFAAAGFTSATQEVPYLIEGLDAAGAETGQWEIGRGTLATTTTLVRSLPQDGSSGAGTPVPFSSASLRVTCGNTVFSVARYIASLIDDQIATPYVVTGTPQPLYFASQRRIVRHATTVNVTVTIGQALDGSWLVYELHNTSGAPITVTWPAWNNIDGPVPTVVAAGQVVRVYLECRGSTGASDVWASGQILGAVNVTPFDVLTPVSNVVTVPLNAGQFMKRVDITAGTAITLSGIVDGGGASLLIRNTGATTLALTWDTGMMVMGAAALPLTIAAGKAVSVAFDSYSTTLASVRAGATVQP